MFKEIDGETMLYALFGHPARHSKSPKLHNAGFSKLQINARYLSFDVEEDFSRDIITSIRTLDIKGCNLTMPFKNLVIPYLDRIDDEARLSDSVNTIKNENGILTGYTTDGKGYIDSLKDSGFSVKDKNITVLGAGGAARSIVVHAALLGAGEIFIFKRKNNTFKETLDFFNNIKNETGAKISVLPYEDEASLRERIKISGLLINCTNVGMGDDKRSPVDPNFLGGDIFVSDIIYHPMETTLLKEAKKRGLRTKNGEDMLYFQGAESFKIWTGKDYPLGKDVIK